MSHTESTEQQFETTSDQPLRGLTLVELMVAVVLMVILVGVITFVWMQSNKIFATTVHRLETYQRLRTVLDLMERDLANTNRTVNMEFYVDKDLPAPVNHGNGHYDANDDPFLVTYSGHSEVPDGTEHFRYPRDPLDPLKINGEDEFGLPGFNPDPGPDGSVPYMYSPTILSPPPYMVGAGYTDNRFYWRDEIYVSTFANVDGVNRPALVHYRLVKMADGRSALRRRIWYLDESGGLIPPDPKGTPAVVGTDQTSILATGVCDLKVGFFFKETTTESVGQWYHVGDISPGNTYFDEAEGGPGGDPALKRGSALLDSDAKRGFLGARTQPLSAQHVNQFGPDPDDNAISFFYQGNARIELTLTYPPVLRTLDNNETLENMPLGDGPSGDLSHYKRFDFPGVRPSDRFLIYDATDDDDFQAPGIPGKQAGAFFPDRILTVDAIFSDATEEYVGVKFREQINFAREIKTWLGDEPDVNVTAADIAGTYVEAGPAPDPDGRTIIASFNVKYRVGFLPAAFLIRLSVDDRHNNTVLPMERVIRLLQQ